MALIQTCFGKQVLTPYVAVSLAILGSNVAFTGAGNGKSYVAGTEYITSESPVSSTQGTNSIYPGNGCCEGGTWDSYCDETSYDSKSPQMGL